MCGGVLQVQLFLLSINNLQKIENVDGKNEGNGKFHQIPHSPNLYKRGPKMG